MESLFKHFGLSGEDIKAINKRGIKKGAEAGSRDDGAELVMAEDANFKEIDIISNRGEVGEVFDINIEANKINNGVKKGEPANEGRRFFLKQAAGATVGAAAIGFLGNDVVRGSIKGLEKIMEFDDRNQGSEDLINEETKKMLEENALPIRDLIKYNAPGRIDLTTIDTLEILKNYWKERHQKSPELRNSLAKAYREMTTYHEGLDGSYADIIKEKFREVGVPEEFCFLAIPESYWNMKARSGAGAVGPYQFTVKTAKQWKLITDDRNDERMDPVRSGWACAKQLKYLYDNARKDWNLALSGYNGGQLWLYLHKDHKKNHNLTPYRDFLAYVEDEVNKIRDEIKKENYQKHKVVKGDTIGAIAVKYGKKKAEIISLNKIKNTEIKIGEVLNVPYTEEEKENVFNARIAELGYFENLTYPAKFNAINELIKEGFVVAERHPNNSKLAHHNQGKGHKIAVIEPDLRQTKNKKV
ncbi:lytic transglycosylase [Candidatus Parcubacteria bacterium]|nr:lytic transglycosylase [Patescibacteria group bacterium]MBU4309924.1 lytic transglycosylase [Patescibacteria group bacterium]MBU4432073.1 lytic transglycosylase [Patescibacteria group bacterium]MBU4577849.1 lytic transglycosylase [Patescibacteria group bacterium]MCG2696910.1 lytic transglycosylase [Candidatus Parcubacteria bacterium]